ncbi:hypothetical protein ACET3Z_021322 [Daucus carota]
MVGACPSVKRIWVQKKGCEAGKEDKVEVVTVTPDNPEDTTVQKADSSSVKTKDTLAQNQDTFVGSSSGEGVLADDEKGWTTVGNKKGTAGNKNPESVNGDVELPIYRAIAKAMTKGQLKRSRRNGGRNSPHKK